MTDSVTTPDSRCPFCGYGLDRAWNREGHTPSPGDLAICFGCGEWLQFDANLQSVKPDDEAYQWLVSEAEPRIMREVWLKCRAEEDKP
jgi:hypothetical protein